MSDDNPFAAPDPDETVVRPSAAAPRAGRGLAASALRPDGPPAAAPARRGLREALRVAATGGRPHRGPDGPLVPVPRTGVNPLCAAAAPLLALIARLQAAVIESPADQLRDQVIAGIREFEERARGLPMPREALHAAHYALCATLDDIVLNTPWGARSIWATGSLTSFFHNEVTGGERFFSLLQRLQRNPQANRDALELMYLCLALGFEGRYRLSARGPAELARVRDELYRLLSAHRPSGERELSALWRGAGIAHGVPRQPVPPWVLLTAGLALLLAVHVGLAYPLNRRSDALLARLAQLPPTAAPALERPPPELVTAPPVPPPPAASPNAGLRQFLAPEIAAGLVSVLDSPDGAVIRIAARGMFAAGSAVVEGRFHPLLARVADALAGEGGRVIVLGHTDATPIRSVRFPSNWHLSMARAEAVRNALADGRPQLARTQAEGRADLEPIASNDDPVGRERNRRTDIVLQRLAAAPVR
jgi:type VI secretion system protein ImpK